MIRSRCVFRTYLKIDGIESAPDKRFHFDFLLVEDESVNFLVVDTVQVDFRFFPIVCVVVVFVINKLSISLRFFFLFVLARLGFDLGGTAYSELKAVDESRQS